MVSVCVWGGGREHVVTSDTIRRCFLFICFRKVDFWVEYAEIFFPAKGAVGQLSLGSPVVYTDVKL